MNNSAWHTLFWNSDGKRLRPLWRLLIQLAMLGFLLVCEIFAFMLTVFLLHWQIPDTALFALNILFELVAFTGSIYLARRFLDHRPFLDLGIHPDALMGWDILRGMLVAFVMLSLAFVAMYQLGWLHITGLIGQSGNLLGELGQAGLFFLLLIVVAFQEELLCRGYILQTITSGWGKLAGILFSSCIFALLHIGNPGINGMAALGIFCAGLLLDFAAVRTGNLWLAIGIHLGWNFCEGMIFGFPTSGVAIPSLLHIQVTGPVLWTGGAFGPEAGLIILPALVIGAGLMWVYTM
jgi:uncharacterized protein